MKRFSVLLAILGALLAILFLTACGPEKAPLTKELPVLNNQFTGGKLTRAIDIPGEQFQLETEYSTEYDTRYWHITDTKNLRMNALIKGAPEGTVVLVEHVHADISVMAGLAMVHGLPQDSMDDSIHGSDQGGFWITDKYPYDEVFVIEGYSQTLISGWGFIVGGLGMSSLSEDRLTEHNLVEGGKAYGEKMQVVYDLLIRYPNEPLFHTRSVVDEFLIPVAGGAGNMPQS